MRLPKIGLQQIGVVAHEDFAHTRVAEQKGAEGFGEHVVLGHVVPDVAAHFLVFVARLRHAAEVAIGDVFNFVVVVEHHLAVARDAKVLPQHVAGEDVGRHQVFDGVAVFDHGALQLRLGGGVVAVFLQHLKGFLQIDVERNHAPFDIDVLDHHLDGAVAVAVADFDLARGKLFDFFDQVVVEAGARKTDFGEFKRIGHAPDPVVLLDELVFAPDLLARGVFLRRVKIFDDLEHKGEAGQVEHQHDHALDAGGDAELVGAVPHVVQKIAVKQRFALLGQAQRVVELGPWLARHHAAQELHVGAGHLHVDHKIGAGKAEYHQQIVFAVQQGVDQQLAAVVVQNRQRKRQLLKAIDELAHRISALVAVKQAVQHLDLEIGAQLVVLKQGQQRRIDRLGVALKIFKRGAQAKIAHHAAQFAQQVVALRVIAAVAGVGLRVLGFQVFGAHRRAHENKVVLEIAAVQNFGADRIEKGFGQLGLAVVHQHAHIKQLDLLPDLHRQLRGVVFALQPRHTFFHAQVVELDALALGALLAVPVLGFEAVLGARRFGPKQAVMAVKAVDHGKRNVVRQGGVEPLRQGGGHRQWLQWGEWARNVAKRRFRPPH